MKVTKSSGPAISLEGGAVLRGKRMADYFRKAAHLYLYCVTIGGRVEEEASRRMKNGDSLGGYLLDRAGSFAVESLAASVEGGLRKKQIAKKINVSARLSPGYCDLPMEAQRTLSRLVPFSAAGVRLNRALMMIPRKSISAIVGIGPGGAFGKAKSQCGMCDRGDCDYRRV
jgi:cobalamin-dependent methionine synthase I